MLKKTKKHFHETNKTKSIIAAKMNAAVKQEVTTAGKMDYRLSEMFMCGPYKHVNVGSRCLCTHCFSQSNQ